jgi:hypothetical protein
MRIAQRISSGVWMSLALWTCGAGAQTTPSQKTPPPTTPIAWSNAAVADIDYAYSTLLENHPGVSDPSNPGFRSRLRAARSAGLALARQVRSAAGYSAAINRFNTVIGDGHAGAHPTLDASLLPKPRWPGFLAVWRTGALVVFDAEPGGPQPGSRILDCDGYGVHRLLHDNVFRFIGREAEPGNWWTRSVNLFVDDANPFVVPPKRCRFQTSAGLESRKLVWTPVNADYTAWRKLAYNGDDQPVGLTEPAKGLVWIAMPTFDPDAAQRDAYRQMFAAISADRARVLNARAVVIDLRANQGGSSDWSLELAAALWGQGRVDRAMADYYRGVEIWWRASKGNADYVAHLVEVLRAEQQIRDAEAFAPVATGLAAAHAKGLRYFVEASDTASPAPPGDEAPALTTPVYVIVPGQCASACLDALDTFTRFPNTHLIGAPSSADSTYLEIRTQPSPSGLSIVVIPNKMWVHRPRAAGAAYKPAIEVSTLTWSTADFLAAIERDLREAAQHRS